MNSFTQGQDVLRKFYLMEREALRLVRDLACKWPRRLCMIRMCQRNSDHQTIQGFQLAGRTYRSALSLQIFVVDFRCSLLPRLMGIITQTAIKVYRHVIFGKPNSILKVLENKKEKPKGFDRTINERGEI